MEPKLAAAGAIRYPIALELTYRMRDRARRAGSGHSQAISSRELVFTADQPIETGARLEISISWPVLLNRTVPLQLVLETEVVGRAESVITARIVKYQFRTRRMAGGSLAQTAAPFHHPAATVQQEDVLCAR